MGIVYRAWDEPLRRPVALKMLRKERAHQIDRLRLIREAQLAACFRNDHAVTIHSVVDPPDELPYLVMEYVDGPTLAELIASRNPPDPLQVTTWLAQVAEALLAAHTAGLIHRDVKPSNILIERATGRAKITDFGLARAQSSHSALTREGFLVGTPSYMSPEQVGDEQNLDARTDVYSLGATLYEALTGVTPYQGAPHLVFRQVMEEDPRPLRQLNDRVPRDLETICLKAMAKERDRRYQSAGEFAEELRRWLRSEPIHARPATRVERIYRLCRRNPRVATLSASLALALLAGFFGVFWQWRRAERNADRAMLHRQRALASLKDAQASFERARRAVDGFYTRFYEQGVLAVPGMEKVRHDVLDEMLRYYKDFLDQHQNDPTLRRELAESCLRLGRLTFTQGNMTDGLGLLRRALGDFERLVQEFPDDRRLHDQMSVCLNIIGQLEDQLGQADAARVTYERAIRALDKRLGKTPGDQQIRRFLAAVHGNLASLYLMKLKDRSAASRSYRRALALQEELVKQDPADVLFRNDLATTYNNLSFVVEDPVEALHWCEKALEVRKQLVAKEPTNTWFRHNVARTQMLVGLIELKLNRAKEGLSSLEESCGIFKQVVAEQPEIIVYRTNLAQALYNLGGNLANQDRFEEAKPKYAEAREIYQKAVHANPEDATSRQMLGAMDNDLAEIKKRLADKSQPNSAPTATVARTVADRSGGALPERAFAP
jgi:tetratricopeptide (TPR) repeat protein